jgi:hypothetical protein
MSTPRVSKSVVEIGVEVTAVELVVIECFLLARNIPYYVEPPNGFVSLEDLECACEGK